MTRSKKHSEMHSKMQSKNPRHKHEHRAQVRRRPRRGPQCGVRRGSTTVAAMADWLPIAAAAVAGLALGAAYFGALWWSVRALAAAATTGRAPPLLALGFVLRLAAAAGGLYLIGGGQWQRLLAGLCGFLLARALALRVVRRRHMHEEGRHAPQS